jgi:hypothetical protein
MPIFGDLVKGGAEGILAGAGALARDIRAAVTGKEVLTSQQLLELKVKAAELESAVLSADVEIAKGQIAINRDDAQSGSVFRGGWRPAVGWICAASLLYTFLLRPIAPWVVGVCGVDGVPPLPAVDTQTLMTLLLGMLGLGGFRTFEKIKGLK